MPLAHWLAPEEAVIESPLPFAKRWKATMHMVLLTADETKHSEVIAVSLFLFGGYTHFFAYYF